MNVVETDRLALRQLSTGDAPFILELLNEPSFLRFIGDRGVRTLDDAREYISTGPVDSYDRLGFGLYLTALKEDDLPIGICGLVKRKGLDDVDIGYAFLPRFWSKKYAFRHFPETFFFTVGFPLTLRKYAQYPAMKVSLLPLAML